MAMLLSISLLCAPGFNSFFLACLEFIFSHLQVTTYRVEKLRSEDDWWRLSVISWGGLLWIYWFLLNMTHSTSINLYNDDNNFSLVQLKTFCFLFCHSVNFLILDSWKCQQKRKEKNRGDLSSVDSRVQFLWFWVARTMSLIFLMFGLLYVSMYKLDDLSFRCLVEC